MPVRKEESRRGTERRGSAKSDNEGSEKPKKGWGALAQAKKEQQERNENQGPPEFWLIDGGNAVIQFIDDEPLAIEGHNIKLGAKGKFRFVPCQLSMQRHCVMCQDGAKKSTRYGFRLWDYRGKWDKDKEKHLHDGPIAKVWLAGMKVADSLASRRDKRGKELTEMVMEVSRSGSGTQSTYNFEDAYDEKDNRMKPADLKVEIPTVDKLIKPLTDEALSTMGFEISSD